ncbi:SGNH/GDSL hydrolase family protein [Streptomyces xiaopingdaonensis]|uniref:SGNH/GDSL hydrolase family protein n=1 Tax=Streptomyces xiaopingdaonensis TaxID=1565415 RepID=UPI0003069FDD
MHRRLTTSILVIVLTALGTTTAVAQSATAPSADRRGANTTATDREPATTRPQPLSRLYDNRAVGDPDARTAHTADFDGAGNSLSAQDLEAAGWHPGTRLRLDGADLERPDRKAGEPDNVVAEGQHVRVRGTGNALSFLVAATTEDAAGRAVGGSGTVRYADGSESRYTLTAEDWRGGPVSTKAVALPHLNTPGGPRAEQTKLYAVTVPLQRGEPVDSVQLPRTRGSAERLHVFDVAVREDGAGWTGSWAASTGGYAEVGPWQDQTLRLVVHASSGGPKARVRLANTFAGSPVRIGPVSVGVQREGAQARGRPVPLTFNGRAGTVVPAGAEVVSDPVAFDVPTGADLLVSLHLPERVTAAPLHSETRQLSYVSNPGSGDRTGEPGGGSFTGRIDVWPFLTGVDTAGGPGSVVTLGDSITDGTRSTEGANNRWPDILAARLRDDSGSVPAYGVLNHGISANRIVTDRYPGDGVSTDTAGVSAQHRLERDVLGQTSARTVVLFEGINDVRWGTSAEEVIAGMKAIAARARAQGLRVVAGTVTPCEGYTDCTAEVEARRAAVNSFLRSEDGTFDAFLDFDAAVRDPSHPTRMLPAYDSGDHLHPGDAGLKAMADSIDLRKLHA